MQYDKDYTYILTAPLDAPQIHATWIDAAHIAYVSKGAVHIVDYDGTNQQSLETADPNYIPVFDQSTKYTYLYTH